MSKQDKSNKEQKTEQKVVAYICRFHDGLWQLLVFNHDPKFKDAGTQVPAGTVEPQESLQTALEREVFEESGLQDLMILSKIDEYEYYQESKKTWAQRHVFLMLAPQDLPEKWTHEVQGHGDDAKMQFHYFWMPAAATRGKLAADFDKSIKNLVHFLFQRDQNAH